LIWKTKKTSSSLSWAMLPLPAPMMAGPSGLVSWPSSMLTSWAAMRLVWSKRCGGTQAKTKRIIKIKPDQTHKHKPLFVQVKNFFPSGNNVVTAASVSDAHLAI